MLDVEAGAREGLRVDLVERDEPMAALSARLAATGPGAGRFVLVTGEAGIGKTTLVRAFCAAQAGAARVWWGACDALSTPRPLGPLYDIARTARGELAAVMASDASRHERFAAALEALRWPLQPTIVVVEDVHWADEGTRDLLVFLARRVHEVNALVIVTYRDDEVAVEHPLRQVLGHIATVAPSDRLVLRALSEAGVAQLAEGRAGAGDVHRVTGGNPFFVTEVLASPTVQVPASVADAVLLRARSLSPPARALLDVAAVVPREAEIELLVAVTGHGTADLEECLERGLLVATGRTVRFRHEIARLAVEGASSAVRRRQRHEAVLGWLRERSSISPARLAYHAAQADDPDAILTFAPRAAQEASRHGAHREAYEHHRLAAGHAHLLPGRERADLLGRFAGASSAVGRFEEAFAATGAAVTLLQELGEVEEAALATARRAGIAWNLARNEDAHRWAADALAMLAPIPPGVAHGRVAAMAASLRMLARDIPGAIELGSRALELAERHDDTEALTAALGAIGAAQWFAAPEEAEATMLRGLEAARAAGDDRRVAGILGTLGSGAGEVRRYAIADRWLAATIEWAEARDLDYQAAYARAWSARSAAEQGRWVEAADLVAQLERAAIEDRPTRIVLLTVQGRLATRRGEPSGPASLAEAWELASRTGDLQRLWPVAAGRAEAAWLAGRPGDAPALIGDTLALADRLDHHWAIGELAFWMWRAGQLPEPPADAAEPFALQIEGDWRAAAAAWEQLGCPYEAAVALADGDDPQELLRAFEILAGLGAAPMADRVAAQLRAMGVRELPRRPSKATVANPGGLTDRQLQVLELLGQGCTNPQIAARLHISPKTAGHHVSAILDKLGAADRREAARVARERSLIGG